MANTFLSVHMVQMYTNSLKNQNPPVPVSLRYELGTKTLQGNGSRKVKYSKEVPLGELCWNY